MKEDRGGGPGGGASLSAGWQEPEKMLKVEEKEWTWEECGFVGWKRRLGM